MDYSVILGIIGRHFLTGAAGWLVSHGLLSADPSATEAFTGAVLLIAGVGWSFWQKYGKVAIDAAIAKKHGIATALAIVAVFGLAGKSLAADMPVKAPAVPFIVGYSGNGFYKGVGTFAEMDDAQTVLGSTNTFGGALNAVVGYQWANATKSTFGALQGSCAYHNVGGSNIVGAITSKWSCEQMIKFGGPITNVLQWLPAGGQMPALPAIGSAIGGAHPWIGAGVREQDAKADVVGVTKHNISVKGFLAAGILQQYCTAPTSCMTTDTFFEFNPSQDGFSLLGTQQKLGKGYRAGMNFYF